MKPHRVSEVCVFCCSRGCPVTLATESESCLTICKKLCPPLVCDVGYTCIMHRHPLISETKSKTSFKLMESILRIFLDIQAYSSQQSINPLRPVWPVFVARWPHRSPDHPVLEFPHHSSDVDLVILHRSWRGDDI